MFELHSKANELIEELINHHITYFFIAPGSRSTPLTQAIAHKHECRDFIHYDERSLGFMALGASRAKKTPSVIVTTSGSALANLYPAIVEAYQDNVPLIILSADRPFELQECGANQTMHQSNFFQRYSHYSKDLPLCDQNLDSKTLKSIVSEAIFASQTGPVHLNCSFREPLVLNQVHLPKTSSRQSEPYIQKALTAEQLLKPVTIDPNQKGWIYCCRGISDNDFASIEKLAQSLEWPIVVDVLCKARFKACTHIIQNADELFKHAQPKIETLIHFGGPITSKEALHYFNKQDFHYHLVSQSKPLPDPNRLTKTHYPVSAASFCCQVELKRSNTSTERLNQLKILDQKISDQIKVNLKGSSEPSFIHTLFSKLPHSSQCFVGASLAIRLVARFSPYKGDHLLYSNRGVSGIDGNLSTACGLAYASNQPTTALIGDLTFFHDIGALLLLNEIKTPLRIIIVNNNGGGIFNFLEISKEKSIFERYFKTPHNQSVSKIIKGFGIPFTFHDTLHDFSAHIARPPTKHEVIELKTCSEKTCSFYQQLDQTLSKCVQSQNLETALL